jgi:hypothetical protein
MIYRALKDQLVAIPYGHAPVKKGERVQFDHDPGEGWEVTKDAIHSSSENGQERSTLRPHR